MQCDERKQKGRNKRSITAKNNYYEGAENNDD